jgi:deoxycytidine triphosphate deaminase
MILTDGEIAKLIQIGEVTFNPPLESGQIKSSAIDLRLGNNFSSYPYDTSSLPENIRSMLSLTVDLRDE